MTNRRTLLLIDDDPGHARVFLHGSLLPMSGELKAKPDAAEVNRSAVTEVQPCRPQPGSRAFSFDRYVNYEEFDLHNYDLT